VEWNILEDFLGKDIAGYKMKSYNGRDDWMDDYGEIKNGNGDNSSGFNVLPSGFREKTTCPKALPLFTDSAISPLSRVAPLFVASGTTIWWVGIEGGENFFQYRGFKKI